MKKLKLSISIAFIAFAFLISACKQSANSGSVAYHDTTGRKDILSGGVQLIPIQTEKGPSLNG